MRDLVPLAALKSRPIQRAQLNLLSSYRQSDSHKVKLDCKAKIPQECQAALPWWGDIDNLRVGLPMQATQPTMTLITDASDTGWGGHLMNRKVQGIWRSSVEQNAHINMKEMLAVLYSLKQYQHMIRDRTVLLKCDNTTTVSYLSKEGGTRSYSLNDLAVSVLNWCHKNRVHLNIQYMAGKLNTVADSLSRQRKFKDTEWQIAQDMTTLLFKLWPLPTIDLFATSQNAKCKAFITRIPDKQAIGWDALQMSWDNLDTYAFPPFPLIMKVVQKVKRSHNMRMTLLAPMWQSQRWFPTLLEMLIDMPRSLPPRPDLLTQPDGPLPMSPAVYQLHAWRLSSDLSCQKRFQARSHRQQATPMHGALRDYTSAIGPDFALGVCNGIIIHSIPLGHN
jgi:hypothetical protein